MTDTASLTGESPTAQERGSVQINNGSSEGHPQSYGLGLPSSLPAPSLENMGQTSLVSLNTNTTPALNQTQMCCTVSDGAIDKQEQRSLGRLTIPGYLDDFYVNDSLSPLTPSSETSEYCPSGTDSGPESDDDEPGERQSSSRPHVSHLQLRPADFRRNAKPTKPLPLSASSGLKIRLKQNQGSSNAGKSTGSPGPRSVKKRKLIDGTRLSLVSEKRGLPRKRKDCSKISKDLGAEELINKSNEVVWPAMTNEDDNYNRQLIQCDK